MKEIILSNGMTVLVDEEDYLILNNYKWHARKAHNNTNSYYAVRTVPHPMGAKYANNKTKRKLIQMHRELLNFPSNKEVDHINGNTLDNRKINLRPCTHAENLRNSKLNKRNKTGFRGVRNIKGIWYARIKFNGKEYNKGGFISLEKAARAYDDLARTYFGNFVRLNFP